MNASLTRIAALAALAALSLLVAFGLRPSPVPLREAPSVPAAPGGPILVVGDRASDPGFDGYLPELLRAEGWTAFAARDVSELSSQTPTGTRVIVLGWSVQLTADVAATLDSFVSSGGTLICMRPRNELQGLTGAPGIRAEQRYVDLPLESDAAERGAVVQVFGETYGLALAQDSTIVARFASSTGERLESPAVTVRSYGEGRVVTFGFDLARTVAFLRQGNPSWRGEERDGAPGLRASDAFAGWLDLARAVRPQADDHLRFLSSIIDTLLADRGEPRLWYFPAGEPGMLVVTADAHGTTTAAMQEGLDLIERAGGHLTIYYDPPIGPTGVRRSVRRAWRNLRDSWSPDAATPPTARIIAQWRMRGHEIAPHPVIDERDVSGSYQRSIARFNDEGFGALASTVRTHAVYWKGWVASAKTEATHGFGLTMDYYQSGPWLKRADGGWTHTNYTGSFLPMRIVEENGKVLGIRQLTTTMADEQLIASAYDGWEGLNADGATAVTSEVIKQATATVGIPVLQFHLDFLEPGHPLRPTITEWITRSLALAKTNGMPIWNAGQLLEFEGCREQTRVVDTRWSTSEHLTFRVEQSGTTTCPVTIVIPSRSEPAGTIKVTVDDRSADDSVLRRGRRQLLLLPRGPHAVDVTFSTPPAVSRE